MNLFILLILLAVLTVASLFLNKRDFLAPDFLVFAVFTLSTFLAFVNRNLWAYDISPITIFVVLASTILFAVGFHLVAKKKSRKFEQIRFRYREINKGLLFIINLICIASAALYVLYQYRLAQSLGNTGGILGVIGTIRLESVVNVEILQLPIYLNLLICFTRATGYIFLYLFIDKLFEKKFKLLYLVPVLCLIINTIFATGRAALITIVVATLCFIYAITSKRGIRIKHFGLIIFLVFILFMLGFYLLGVITGKSGNLSLMNTVSIYAGSSIICLDHLLTEVTLEPALYFGQHTFVGIYNILAKIGLNFESGSNHAMFLFFGENEQFSSNVYSFLFPYIQDFGVPFAVLSQFVFGIIFGAMWNKFRMSKESPLMCAFYARFFAGALVMYSIAECFLTTSLALNAFVEMFIYILYFKFVLKPIRIRKPKVTSKANVSNLKVNEVTYE